MAKFVKVMRDARKMCNSFESCEDCALKFSDSNCGLSVVTNDNSCNDAKTKEAEIAIEQWAEFHPEKTNLDALKKVFPKVNFSFDDFCLIKAFGVVKNCDECDEKFLGKSCSEVIKEFLNSPYEEPEEKE